MKILIEQVSNNCLRNFGRHILHSHLKSRFLALEKYIIQPRFKECHFDYNTINTNNETIEVNYTGVLSIKQFYNELSQMLEDRNITHWSVNLVE